MINTPSKENNTSHFSGKHERCVQWVQFSEYWECTVFTNKHPPQGNNASQWGNCFNYCVHVGKDLKHVMSKHDTIMPFWLKYHSQHLQLRIDNQQFMISDFHCLFSFFNCPRVNWNRVDTHLISAYVQLRIELWSATSTVFSPFSTVQELTGYTFDLCLWWALGGFQP